MNLASRMAHIAPFHVMDVMARAQALEAEGRSIVHLEVGEPDFATAEPILDAARRFLSGGHVHYTALPPPLLGSRNCGQIAAAYERNYESLPPSCQRRLL